MHTKYMVVPQGRKLSEVVPVVFELEHYAIEKALELAVATREPQDIYRIELISSSTTPKSSIVDYRPQPANSSD